MALISLLQDENPWSQTFVRRIPAQGLRTCESYRESQDKVKKRFKKRCNLYFSIFHFMGLFWLSCPRFYVHLDLLSNVNGFGMFRPDLCIVNA